jgi:formylglycine-generating enzyme required for sulfatase activity
LRGGSWYNAAGFARAAFRGYLDPSYRNSFYGFRLVFPQFSEPDHESR